MRVVCLNQDKGIDPARKKGAAVHLTAMRTAFDEAGHEVLAFDAAEDGGVRKELRAALKGAGFLYERYALGRYLGSELCAELGVPHVVELNAPLADEERMYRGGALDADLDAREIAVFTRASVVLAVSHQVAEYALERGAAPAAVLVRPNGVDARRFVPRSPTCTLRDRLVPSGRFVLGFHGRLRPWHGIDLLGRVTSSLLADGYPVHLVLVGEGEFMEALGPHVPEDRITCVPWVRHEEMPAYVATFDALPLTYASDGPSYFSPLKLAEAMACGVVPVYPPVGDLPQVMTDGVDALEYAAGDESGLCRALASLIDDADLRARLSRAAVRTARSRSWRSIAEDVVAAVGDAAERAERRLGCSTDSGVAR